MTGLEDLATFAKDVALKAGELIHKAFNGEKHISTKENFADLVTESDQLVENTVRDLIKAKYPDHCFIGEESTSGGAVCQLTDSPTWIIDPIDGTTNFVHRFPYCCISIGVYINKQPKVAIVYNPNLNQCFFAEAGKGAYLNDERIHVSGNKDLSKALVFSDYGSGATEEMVEAKIRNLRKFAGKMRSFRAIGSAALSMCHVACGIGDVYYEFGIHCWDYAAGYLIVMEAGGVVCNPDGSLPLDLMARGVLCASSQELADQCRIEHNIPYPRD